MQITLPTKGSLKWIHSLAWDLAWFQSALWIFPIFFGLYFLVGEFEFKFYSAIVFILFRLMHTYFSAYLCLGHPDYAQVSKDLKFRFYLIPIIITGGITLFFILPQSVFSLSIGERFNLYALLVFPLTYWHYALQHYGVISIYRSKAQQSLTPFHYNLEKWFCHLSTTFLVTILTLKNFYDVSFGGFSLGSFLKIPVVDWNLITFCLIVPLVVLLTYHEFKNRVPSIPKLLYIWSIAFMAILVTSQNLYVSWMLLDMQHFLVVFGLGGHMLSRGQAGRPGKSLLSISTVLISVSIILSLVYFYFNAHGLTPKNYSLVLGQFMKPGENETLNLFFYGFFIATGICHYYFDRLAFRFSDKKIGPIVKKLI